MTVEMEYPPSKQVLATEELPDESVTARRMTF